MTQNLWVTMVQILLSSILSLLLIVFGQLPSNYRRLYQLAKKRSGDTQAADSDKDSRAQAVDGDKNSGTQAVDSDNRVESYAIGQYLILSLIGLWVAYFANTDFSTLPPSLCLRLLPLVSAYIIIGHVALLWVACGWLSRADLAGNPNDAKAKLRNINMSGAVMFHVFISLTLAATVILEGIPSPSAGFFAVFAGIAATTIMIILFYPMLEGKLNRLSVTEQP